MPEPRDYPGPWVAYRSATDNTWLVHSNSRGFNVAWGLTETDAKLIASLKPKAEPGMIPEIIKDLEGLIEKIRKA